MYVLVRDSRSGSINNSCGGYRYRDLLFYQRIKRSLLAGIAFIIGGFLPYVLVAVMVGDVIGLGTGSMLSMFNVAMAIPMIGPMVTAGILLILRWQKLNRDQAK